ncbi:MAG TPA: glycan-binding surface protein, partial [Mucilaginibacter sp.]|nr:glycan-binding surface protein [Mucilaginibacter sp.]
MKKKSFIRLCLLPLLFAMVALFPACKKSNDSGAAPVITGVRSYAASPNDTVLHSAIAHGQWVVITGQNLANATNISFDGVPASFNVALFAPNSAVVQIPTIVFSTIDTTKLYTINYKTTGGSTTFSFKLGPAAPTISAISNVFANPGDSVYIYGANLVLVQHFVYGGTTISSFKSSLDGTALGFLMPAATPTDQIVIATKAGTVNDKIVATPTIIRISNENANPGDSVHIYGTYFKSIQSLSFAGTAITSFTSSNDGTSIGFVLPALSQSGPVSVTTKFGTATTVYNVNDVATGRISDWEWGGNFNWQWWGGATITSGNSGSGWPPYNPDFPGNTSQYMVLKNGVLAPAEGNTYSNYAILMNAAQWVPAANINDPVEDWAFKFEVSVPQAWNGGTIDVLSGVSGYVARWEPWQKTAATKAAYKTNGWMTVTIPLSAFRAADPTLGDGE